MFKFHRELTRRLHDAGVDVTRIEARSKSIVMHCERNGYTMRYYTAVTPSDRRALDNALHDIVRQLRQKEAA